MFGPLCVSVAEADAGRAERRLTGLACAELRLDALRVMPENLVSLAGIPRQCLLTCRPLALSAREQRSRLLEAVRIGPTLLDVDAEAPPEVRDEVLAAAREAGVGVVLSRHWPDESPGLGVLCETVARLLEEKTAVVKVAVRCEESSILAELLSLYSVFPESRERLVVLGMGGLGALARLTILQLGAPFTFVAPDRGTATAPGQLRLSLARRMIDEAGVI